MRFDGVRFTIFDKDNSPGISSNYLTSLYEDPDNALWIGSENSHVIRYRRGEFTSYPLPNAPAGDFVHALAGDQSGLPLVVLRDRLMHWEGSRFLQLPFEGFPKEHPLRIVQHGNRAGFWTFTPHTLAIFAGGRLTTWDRQNGLPNSRIQAVAQDEQGAFWVATDGPLAKIQGGKLKLISRPPDCLANSDLNFVSSPILKLACFSGNDSLLLISVESLVRRTIAPVPAKFPRNIMAAVLYEDREGNLWVGNATQGLYRARKQPITTYSESEGLRDRNVYTVLEDHTGAVWLGAWPGTLSRLEHGRFTNYTRENGLTGREITALYEDRSRRLWVAAYGSERDDLRVLENGRFVVPAVPQNLRLVRAILQDRQGAFWFGTEDKLLRYDHGVATSYTTKDGLASNDVRVLIEDAAGGIWIGGYGGLTRFYAGRLTAYTEQDGMPGANVRTLYQDVEGTLWIGTYDGGLGRLKRGHFTSYKTRDGLFNNGVFQILEDARGNLWISSNHGIYRVRKQELDEFADGKRTSITSVSYGKNDGMRSAECNGGHWPAGTKTRDGKLWFPTQDGVAVINPESVPRNSVPPPVTIESCLLDRGAVAINRSIQMKPDQDAVEIHYTALSLIDSDRIKFRYRLEGLDSKWVEAGVRRTAYYSHLPPGQYTFRVIAANSDGVWNTQGQTLAFDVLTPFYRSWWFDVLAALTVAVLIIYAWKYRVAQGLEAQLRRNELAHLMRVSSLGELSSALAHELNQPLTAILSNAQAAQRFLARNRSDPAEMGDILRDIVADNQRAADVIRRLRTLVKKDEFRLQPLDVNEIVRDVIKLMSTELTARAVAVAAEFTPGLPPVRGDRVQLQQVLINLLLNACDAMLRTSARGRTLTIQSSRGSGSVVQISVADTGGGFPPGHEEKIFEPYHTTKTNGLGLGLSLSRSILMPLGGRLWADNNPGFGATFHILLHEWKGDTA